MIFFFKSKSKLKKTHHYYDIIVILTFWTSMYICMCVRVCVGTKRVLISKADLRHHNVLSVYINIELFSWAFPRAHTHTHIILYFISGRTRNSNARLAMYNVCKQMYTFRHRHRTRVRYSETCTRFLVGKNSLRRIIRIHVKYTIKNIVQHLST